MRDKRTRFLHTLFTISSIVVLATGIVNAQPIFRLVYIVQEGESLSIIANKFDVTTNQLTKVNYLSEQSKLLAGDELCIPFRGEKVEPDWDTKLFSDRDKEFSILAEKEYYVRIKRDPIKINIPKDQLATYYVQRGDTLYGLARKFNTTVAILRALNNMEHNSLRIGQGVTVPIIGFTRKLMIAATITPEQINLMARVVSAEATGEPYMGKVAVAAVILNRVLSPSYPNTIEGVIYQRHQFESVTNGQYNRRPSESAIKAVREALQGSDPSRGAIYFLNPKRTKNTWWFDRRQKTVSIGNHVFAK